MLGGKTYHSTEHYLFAKKAELANDFSALKLIAENKTDPGKIKQIGGKIPMDRSIYEPKAWRWLWDANMAKYEQHHLLRQELFKTDGFRLVECSPKDSFWGVGIERKNSKLWKNSKTWKGLNVMGDLLTHLRRQLMHSPKFQSDLDAIKEFISVKKGETKRMKQSTSPNNVKNLSSDSDSDTNDFVDVDDTNINTV